MRNGNGNGERRKRSVRRLEGPVAAEEDRSRRTGYQPLYSRAAKIRQPCQVSQHKSLAATDRLNLARSRLLLRSLARSEMSLQPSLPSFTEFNKLRYAAKRGYCPMETPCMTGCSPLRTRRAWRAASKDEQRFYSAMPWRLVYLYLSDIPHDPRCTDFWFSRRSIICKI